jgi:acetate kinase
MTPSQHVLTLNAGSSSLKFAIFDAGPSALIRGEVLDLEDAPHFTARDAGGAILFEKKWATPRGGESFAMALELVLTFANEHLGAGRLAAVGHRVVHGGPNHVVSTIVTPALLAQLETLVPFDPLHMPLNLAPIHAIAASHPGLKQVVCFDTAFHRTMPAVARTFALPRDISAAGVQRYGFHGLSFDYIAGRLVEIEPDLAFKRVIIAHLGSGASLCALMTGVSVATTMAFTTLDGLVMATRCGALDPGVVLYLARHGRSLDDIQDMLYHRSGLLGVSGVSGDIRVLAASADPCAREAIDLFVYRLVYEIGALIAALGGLDALVFTAGIGAHSATIRAAVCDRLAWLGLHVDAAMNASGALRISAENSAVKVLVMATDEEAVIARDTKACLKLACEP